MYAINLFTDNTPAAIPGRRNSIIRWKEMSKNGKVYPAMTANRYVNIPAVTLTINHPELNAAMTEAFQDMQDAVIRSKIETAVKAGIEPGTLQVTEFDISPAAIATWHATTNVGTRLSKEMIENWFDTTVKDVLILAFASKQGLDPSAFTAENIKPIEQACIQRRSVLAKLAAPGFVVSPQTAMQLSKAVQLSTDQTSKVTSSLLAKLNDMSVVEPLDNFGL